eukprot:tig00001222_g7599.t1
MADAEDDEMTLEAAKAKLRELRTEAAECQQRITKFETKAAQAQAKAESERMQLARIAEAVDLARALVKEKKRARDAPPPAPLPPAPPRAPAAAASSSRRPQRAAESDEEEEEAPARAARKPARAAVKREPSSSDEERAATAARAPQRRRPAPAESEGRRRRRGRRGGTREGRGGRGAGALAPGPAPADDVTRARAAWKERSISWVRRGTVADGLGGGLDGSLVFGRTDGRREGLVEAAAVPVAGRTWGWRRGGAWRRSRGAGTGAACSPPLRRTPRGPTRPRPPGARGPPEPARAPARPSPPEPRAGPRAVPSFDNASRLRRLRFAAPESRAHGGYATAACFVPGLPGAFVTGGGAGKPRAVALWRDPAGGAEPPEPPGPPAAPRAQILHREHTNRILAVAADGEGNVFSGGADRTVALYHLEARRRTALLRLDAQVNWLGVGSGGMRGQLLVSTIAASRNLQLWDPRAPSLERPQIVLSWDLDRGAGAGDVKGLSQYHAPDWSPCGQYVALGAKSGRVYVWDVRSAGRPASEQLCGKAVPAVALPRGPGAAPNALLAASNDRKLTLVSLWSPQQQ